MTKCRHIEKFNPKVFGPYLMVQYADGETKEFLGFTCQFCPKCGERIHPDERTEQEIKDFENEKPY
jgi:hypothetical protein